MPTIEGESWEENVLQIRDGRIPFDRFVDGKSIISSLDLIIRVGDVNNEETWILNDW